MLTQAQHYEQTRRDVAAVNQQFMELVNCKENPMTKQDLIANIARRPSLWKRFEGFIDSLPDA